MVYVYSSRMAPIMEAFHLTRKIIQNIGHCGQEVKVSLAYINCNCTPHNTYSVPRNIQWRCDRITRLTFARNAGTRGSNLVRFNRVTPLMRRRRLPVSVRARGCVTLSMCKRAEWKMDFVLEQLVTCILCCIAGPRLRNFDCGCKSMDISPSGAAKRWARLHYRTLILSRETFHAAAGVVRQETGPATTRRSASPEGCRCG